MEAQMRKAVELYRELVKQQPDERTFRRELAQSYVALAKWFSAGGNAILERRDEIQHWLADARAIQSELLGAYGSTEYEADLAGTCYQLGYFWYWLAHSESPGQTVPLRDLAPAETAYLEAASRYAKLAREHPLVHAYLEQLSRTYGQLGVIQQETDRCEKAEEMFRLALPGLEKLVREHPEVTQYLRDLAVTYWKLGDVLEQSEQTAARICLYAKAIAYLERWREQDKGNKFAPQFLGQLYWLQGKTLLLDSHLTEAISVWERGTQSNGFDMADQCRLAGRLGRNHVEAVSNAASDVRRVLAERPTLAGSQRFLASVYSSLSRIALNERRLEALKRAQLAELYAGRALDLLRQDEAAEAGNPAGCAELLRKLKKDRSFDPLRSRADFQALLKSLEANAARNPKPVPI
jgi:tetratricopeptide (TPR) repeat protein